MIAPCILGAFVVLVVAFALTRAFVAGFVALYWRPCKPKRKQK